MAVIYSSYVILSLWLLPTLAISAAHSHHHHHHHHHNNNHHQPDKGIKSLHVTLYQHDILNKTSFIIVEGTIGPKVGSISSPLGTISVSRDPLTAAPDPSSELLGSVEGASITSSFNGLDNLAIAKISLNLKGYNGSISVLGSISAEPSHAPVLGGTGDFLLVQGYLIMSIFYINGFSLIYKLEVHLFWPPYAAQALAC